MGNVPELDYDRHDLPPSVHYVGDCLWFRPRARDAALLDADPDRSTVGARERGNLHSGDPFVLRGGRHGLRDLPVEAVLTAGRHRDPEASTWADR